MKRNSSLTSRHGYAASRRGIALLLVLACLLLLAALILGFLLNGQNNLKSSKLYANGSSVKTLADSTVSLVMAQIQQATSNGTTVAWASQPGMIRTYPNYANGTSSANQVNYRLFSWDTPSVTGAYDPNATDAAAITTTGSSAWYNSPAVFFDLNQPVTDSTGVLHYPIVDGNPGDLAATTGLTAPSALSTGLAAVFPTNTLTYTSSSGGTPIPAIDGFWVVQPNTTATSAVGTITGPAVNTGTTTPSNSTTNDIPMPVKWLYVLKDGTIVAPTAVSGKGYQVTVTGASTTNPIVGRIAYWTDDETSKVNINTASEGAYWDTPHAQGATDFNLASFQPVQNEYQRYPGHPSTTCLSTVFGSIAPVDHTLNASNSNSGYTAPSPATYAPYQFYYDLAPKLNADLGTVATSSPAPSGNNLGSEAGTITWYYTGNYGNPNNPVTDPIPVIPNGTTGYLTLKNPGATVGTTGGDRLFASIDDLLFASNLFTDNAHTSSTTLTGAGTPPTRPLTSASNLINQPLLEKTKFFITASSRAPDVNLFNQPRVVCWPVNSSTSNRTTLDTAIAWCGTLNGSKASAQSIYYFQRQRNDHPTNDLPSAAATTGLGRNRMLMTYLENLTSQPIPGFGGTFLTKYPSVSNVTPSGGSAIERDQILTEIFDYIRCLNLEDGSAGAVPFAPTALTTASGGTNNYPTSYANTSSYYNLSSYPVSPGIYYAGAGQVVPIYDTVTSTKGFGRFPTVCEISIMFICTGWNDGAGGKGTNANDPNYKATTASNTPGPTDTTGTDNGHGNTATVSTGPYAPYAPWGYYNDGTNGQPATTPTAPPSTIGMMSGGAATSNVIGIGTTTPPTAQIQVRPIILVTFFDPSSGFVAESNTFSIQLTGLSNFTWPDGSFMFPNDASSSQTSPPAAHLGNNAICPVYTNMPLYSIGPWGAPGWGGNLGFRRFITGNTTYANSPTPGYNFIGTAKNFTYNPATATTSNVGTFSFSGGALTVNLLLPSAGVNSAPDSRFATPAPSGAGRSPTPGWPPASWPLGSGDYAPIQTISVNFPTITNLPLPYYAQPGLNYNGSIPFYDRGNYMNRLAPGNNQASTNDQFTYPGDVVRSVRAVPGDIRMIAGLLSVPNSYYDPTELKIQQSGLTKWDYFNANGSAFQVHSLKESIDYPFYGAILGQLVPGISYAREATTMASGYWNDTTLLNSCAAGGCALATGAVMNSGSPGDWDNGFGYMADGSYINKPDEGDLGFYNYVDHKPDNVPYFSQSSGWASVGAGQTYFSPNHLMPGPGMFGSLPTGVLRNQPWMTLLFCPNPAAGPSHPGFGTGSGTAGPTDVPPYATNPPDHLFLDLFNMPVVEPYPISEPLSTAGRINMNYQIVPFTYIERSTGLRAVLKSERLTVIPDSAASVYKTASVTVAGRASGWDFRAPINLDQTLLGFDNYFSTNKDIFRSASQICQMFLYPLHDAATTSTTGPTWDSANANITNFWNGNTTGASYTVTSTGASPTHYLTGDNSRERPYTTIYPRLTTKSNTFTVHYCVETLKKVTSSTQTLWDETQDQVTGQYRGSSTIERYVDPNDTTLPDFTTGTAAITSTQAGTALDAYYKFRVVSTKQFAP